MKRRAFFKNTSLAMMAGLLATACNSQDRLKGKWQVVKDSGEDAGTFVEFFSDGTRLESTPKLNVSEVDSYKVLEGDRLSLQSRGSGKTEMYSFRFDQGYLFLKGANDREIKYRRNN